MYRGGSALARSLKETLKSVLVVGASDEPTPDQGQDKGLNALLDGSLVAQSVRWGGADLRTFG